MPRRIWLDWLEELLPDCVLARVLGFLAGLVDCPPPPKNLERGRQLFLDAGKLLRAVKKGED